MPLAVWMLARNSVERESPMSEQEQDGRVSPGASGMPAGYSAALVAVECDN
jgi:hypothetical protein